MDILKNILFYLKNKFDDFYIHEIINIEEILSFELPHWNGDEDLQSA